MPVQNIRRLATGHDANGKSIFLMDGDAPNVIVMEKMDGFKVTELWETFDAPADNRERHEVEHLDPTRAEFPLPVDLHIFIVQPTRADQAFGAARRAILE